jgi:hypothetical protein
MTFSATGRLMPGSKPRKTSPVALAQDPLTTCRDLLGICMGSGPFGGQLGRWLMGRTTVKTCLPTRLHVDPPAVLATIL